ncbi:MAG: hypothetical protein ACREOH_00220 [Candidatus Entotheonellia bacterium]
MNRAISIVSLLLWVLLAVEPLTRTAAQAGEVTMTLRTDQATYPVGSQATVTLTLDAATAMTVLMSGHDILGCSWNLVMLDAAGTEVFNTGPREGRGECLLIGMFRPVPPPIVKRATIPLHNDFKGGEPLPPGRYTVRGLFWWQYRNMPSPDCRPSAERGCEPGSAEAVIEITR